MLRALEPHAYALLRIVAGLMFTMHGTQKLLGWPASEGAGGSLPPLILTAGVIELVAGLLILSGLFTRVAAFVSSGTMAAAYFIGHASGGWNPVTNHGELAVVYAFLFLYLSGRGSGIWSLDALRAKGARGAGRERSILARA